MSEGSNLKLNEARIKEVETLVGRDQDKINKSKYKCLEMHILTRENSDAWLYRAERYFEIHELFDSEKMKVFVISSRHNEVDWYRWTHNRKMTVSWEDLNRWMFQRYRPT